MPAIFAIDGAEFGAYSSNVATLQTALVNLGRVVSDSTLSQIAVDGLIGPKTQAATVKALLSYVSGAPAALTAEAASGMLSQAKVSTSAGTIASLVNAEISRRGKSPSVSTSTSASMPAAASARYVSPPSAGTDSTVKWAAVGLGLVVLAGAGYYYMQKRNRALAGDFGASCKPKRRGKR